MPALSLNEAQDRSRKKWKISLFPIGQVLLPSGVQDAKDTEKHKARIPRLRSGLCELCASS
jgi:hypothetical protein